jgi:hypothetical protein
MLHKHRARFGKLQDSESKRHPPPPIDEFAQDLAAGLAEKFASDVVAAKLRALVRHRNELDPTVRKLLVQALELSAERVSAFADQLNFDPLATLKIVES